MQEYVAGLLFNPERNKVVLVRKTKPAWQAGYLNAVGGKVEPNEGPLDAMIREFKEETGLEEDINWQAGFTLMREGVYAVHFYTAVSANYDMVRTVEEEEIEIHDLSPLPENLIPNLNWIIPMLNDPTIEVPTVIRDIAGN